MWRHLLDALILSAIVVCIHATGTYLNLHLILRSLKARPLPGLAHGWFYIIRFVVVLVLIHSAEVAVWAEFYLLQHCFHDINTAYYFSLVTYTTLGYGDVLLPPAWRIMGGWEAMLGVLMFGWSTATLMSIIHHVQGARIRKYFPDIED